MKVAAIILLSCFSTGLYAVHTTESVATLRLDYFHSGNATTESFSLDELVVEPLPWSGNSHKPIDTLLRGKYLFEVTLVNEKSQADQLVYSRSFSSIYGEWETTEEATQIQRSFHESLRFPNPKSEFSITLKKRDSNNQFQSIWNIKLNPNDFMNHRESANYAQQVVSVENNGDSANKVDLLILGDGYSQSEQAEFAIKARQLSESFLSSYPFNKRRKDFNIWALAPVAKQSGVSRPSTGIYRDSPLGATYDAFRSERYVLTFDNKSWRRVASSAPYDAVIIITNSDTYGGGGIYGLYSTAAANSDWAHYLFVHEFGHHFAGLADEYYTSSVAYQPSANKVEPYEPNVTALQDPANLKWKQFLQKGTAIPTDWPKQAFEKHSLAYQKIRNELRADNKPEAEMNALFVDNQNIVEKLFSQHPNSQVVGAYEGANYAATGYYRSSMNCIMFTRTQDFCQVCAQAVEQMIDLLVK